MSKISLDLSSIKSAGIYTIEIDESQRTETQVTALRLLVGFAGKGPFNRAVFLQNEAQRQKLFGDIDTKLEKKGCFFNRAAKTMLDNGPILALNLLKVDDSFDGPDQVNYAALSLDAGKKNPVVKNAGVTYGEVDYLADSVDKQVYETKTGDIIPFVGKAPYASMFDRSRFWTPSDSNLMNVASIGVGAGANSYEKANFINFANTGTDEISLLVFKPDGFTGYDITAKDWYGGEKNIPYGWIRPSDYISDYFIRVVAVKGNWSNYPILSADSTWGKYFDSKGILKNKIYQFSQAEGVTFIGSWTGSIIPDFTDKQGNYLYIKERVNAQTESTGVLMSINEDAMQLISYDKNGVDLATGIATGRGAWIYDYDGNNEADSASGESEIGSNGFLIDMVGHGFQNGVRYDTSVNPLSVKFDSVIFDGGVGTLKSDSSVYYLDDAALNGDLSGQTNMTTVKTPVYATSTDSKTTGGYSKGDALHLYGVYDASTGRRLKTDYCYVALSEDKFKELSSFTKEHSGRIYNMVAYNASGVSSGKTISTYASGLNEKLRVKDDLSDNTLYRDASVLYGSYAAYNNDSSSLYIFKIQSTTTGSDIEQVKIVDLKGSDTSAWATDPTPTNVVEFSYNATSYAVKADDKPAFYVRTETGTPSVYGVNFLSYNYVSNTSEEVLRNVRNAYYFNGKANTAGSDDDPVTLVDTSLFNGTNPVSSDALNTFIITDEDEAGDIAVGDLVENIAFKNNTGESTKYGLIPGVTRVTKKIFVNLTADNKFTYNGKKYSFNSSVATPIRTKNGRRGFYLFTAIDPVLIDKDHMITRQLPISSDVISKSLRFIPLKGLQISSRHRPGFDENGRISINDGIKKIYSVLEDEGIQRGLCNENMISYRYIVDSMSYGIDNELGGKVYLARLAANRTKCTALINAPSKHQFEVSSDPVFCATYDSEQYVKPAFDTKYLAQGGNPDMYSTRQFTLPTEDDGSKYVGVFYPHLVYRDNNHEILVPPAADVSNTFVRKFQGGDPYAITANMDGIIRNANVVRPEVDVDSTDRGYLEQIGINAIIREGGNVKIYANKTAYQDTKSDFNLLSSRENLNTMELAIDDVLKDYNFKYNTATTRAAIITAVTPIMEAMKLSKAIDYYTLICDETNNTEDIIMNDFGILDVEVYLNHGMEKIVTRVRVRKHSDIPVTE